MIVGFTAVAKFGWMNGLQPNGEYRRIVFAFYQTPIYPKDEHYQGYFLIDELTRITKEEAARFLISFPPFPQ